MWNGGADRRIATLQEIKPLDNRTKHEHMRHVRGTESAASGIVRVDKSGEKLWLISLSIIFFFGLLVALAAILERTFRAHWAAIAAALRGVPAAPAPAAATAAGPARPPPARALPLDPRVAHHAERDQREIDERERRSTSRQGAENRAPPTMAMTTIASSRTLRRSRSEPQEKVATLEITRKATKRRPGRDQPVVAAASPIARRWPATDRSAAASAPPPPAPARRSGSRPICAAGPRRRCGR